MNVSLTPELEKLIHRKVRGGMYRSASEVIREALRLLEQYDRMRDLRLRELRRLVDAGIRDFDRGQETTFDRKLVEEIKRRGRKRARKNPRKRHSG